MKNIFFIGLVFFSILLSACQPSVVQETETESESESYQVDVVNVHRHYLRYGETEPFTNEYGKVVRYTKRDTTLLEYCKDSTITFHRPSGEFQTSRSKFCYPQKTAYIQNNYFIAAPVLPFGKSFKRSQIKSTFDLTVGNQVYPVSRVFSISTEDPDGAKVIMHSNEYWAEGLGLLFKIDENFGIKRRRIIKTVGVKDDKGNVIDIAPAFDQIYQDSTDWITKREDGTPWF